MVSNHGLEPTALAHELPRDFGSELRITLAMATMLWMLFSLLAGMVGGFLQSKSKSVLFYVPS